MLLIVSGAFSRAREEAARIGDPDIPSYAIRVMRNGTEAEITGGFKFGLTDDFLRVVRASPRIGVLHLNSLGGRIGEAERLNGLIRERKLVTYVSGQCVSAFALEEQIIRTAAKRPPVDEQMASALWKKVSAQLLKSVGPDKIKVLTEENIAASRYADYCEAARRMYTEITNLDPRDAGLLMRQSFSHE